jgi:hypothetical protein
MLAQSGFPATYVMAEELDFVISPSSRTFAKKKTLATSFPTFTHNPAILDSRTILKLATSSYRPEKTPTTKLVGRAFFAT